MDNIDNIILKHNEFFKTGKTKDIKYRLDKLKTLKKSIISHEEDIKRL